MTIHRYDFALLKTLKSLPRGLERVLEHISTCAKCRSRKRSAYLAADRFRRSTEPNYDSAIERSFQVLETREAALARERGDAPGLFARLAGLPLGRQQILVRNSRRFHSWGLLELLIKEGREETFTDPKHAEEIFQLGLGVSTYLHVSYYGKQRIEDLRARTWSYIGNARRARGEIIASEEAFKEASSRLRRGTGDALEQAVFFDLKASLRRLQRRFGESRQLSRQALSIFGRLRAHQQTGVALINLGVCLLQAGKPELTLSVLGPALDLIDPARDPRMALFALHNLSDALSLTGRFSEAQRVMVRARPLYYRLRNPQVDSRRMWVEARIAFGLGHHQDAETLLAAARDGFTSAGAHHDGVLVSRALASLRAGSKVIP